MSKETIISMPARRWGKTEALRQALERAKKSIQDVRENGWMKPWSIYTNGRRVQVVTPEDCEKHRKLRGRAT